MPKQLPQTGILQNTAEPVYIVGPDGNNVPAGTTTDPSAVVGNVASGSADSGAPVKAGGKYNNALPSLADGQRGDLQLDSAGNLRALGVLRSAAGVDGTSNNIGAFTAFNSQSTTALAGVSAYGSNGTTLDQARTIQGSTGTGVGVMAVATAPHSAASGALAPTVTSAVASSLILKASAGNLYDVSITTGASAGYLMVFNATSAPVDGAVTPQYVRAVAANTTVDWNATSAEIPERFTTGITAVFSTTGPFTKTASATAFIRGRAQ